MATSSRGLLKPILAALTACGAVILLVPEHPSRAEDAKLTRTTVTLRNSGPIFATQDNQIIENVRVFSEHGSGISINGFSNVTVRNVEIFHQRGAGISFSNAPNLTIENANIVHADAPISGPHVTERNVNIVCSDSPNPNITRVKLTRGSSGIYLVNCDGARLSFVEGHDFRGPFPRGQLVQFDKTDDCVLEDFSSDNPRATSWPEDVVSVYQSSNCVVRRGLIDGNNAPSGVGVMIEQTDGRSSNTLVQDVDAIRMGNGCFSAYPGVRVTFERVGCRENICSDQGRGPPLSGGLAMAAGLSSIKIRILDSVYFSLCQGLTWPAAAFTTIELVEKDFELRPPIRLIFPWERGR